MDEFESKKSGRKLTARQLKFIEVYEGNGTEAARLAGYSGDDNALGVIAHGLLRNIKIAEAIQKRSTKVLKPLIASREKRQAFWTSVMETETEEMRERLKASELLGRSEADFVEKHEVSGPGGEPLFKQSEADLKARLIALRSKTK